VHHPAITEAGQRLVDAQRNGLALLVGAAGVVGALVQPGGHEGAVFADHHAIIDQRGVVEQIGQPGIPGAVLFELQFLVDRTDAGVEHEQQQGAEGGNGEGDSGDHWYCFPWLAGLSRNGVLRAG
jgi:hypothetical protein